MFMAVITNFLFSVSSSYALGNFNENVRKLEVFFTRNFDFINGLLILYLLVNMGYKF